MGQLESMRLFIRVVEVGSISGAANQLNLAKSVVSRRLAQLEEQLGVTLLNRTTRRISLTDAGARYYQRSLSIVEEVETLVQDVSDTRQSISGPLHLAVPLTFGNLHLTAAIDEFLTLYPKIELKLSFSDRQHHLIEQGIDVALRIAELKDSTLKAKRLTDIRFVICGSPEYLNRMGRPQTPADLMHHQILHYHNRPTSGWQLIDSQGLIHNVQYQSYLSADNGEFLKDLAIAGRGLSLVPTFIGWQAILTGELEVVLPQFRLPDLSAWLVYSNTRFQSRRLRVLIDFMSQRFGSNPYWDQALSGVLSQTLPHTS